MKPFWCLEAGFSWLNSEHPDHGAVSYLAVNDFGSVTRNTVDGHWFGYSHDWNTTRNDLLAGVEC